MTLINISRSYAENMPWSVSAADWLISIYGSNDTAPNIKAPFGKVFQFQFDDVEYVVDGYVIMSDEQAEKIAGVIKEAGSADIRCLWVHCAAGICRSGAVVEAAALLGHLIDDECSNQRVPNRYVFNKLAKALGFNHAYTS